MEKIYYIGVGISALIGCLQLAIGMLYICSRSARNLRKIGCYYNFWDGHFTATRPNSLRSLTIVVIYLIFIAPLFSWLSVLSFLVKLVWFRISKVEPPDALKELLYKIAHIELSKEEMRTVNDQYLYFIGRKGTTSATPDGDDWAFHCAVIGVSVSANNDQIRKAYREAATLLHPDRHDNSEIAKRKFQELNKSYEYLIQVGRRRPDVSRSASRPDTDQNSSPENKYTSDPTGGTSTPPPLRQARVGKTSSLHYSILVLSLFGLLSIYPRLRDLVEVETDKDRVDQNLTTLRVPATSPSYPVPKCNLQVLTTPSGAEVVLENLIWGYTPIVLSIPCSHPTALVLRKEGYDSLTKNVSITKEGSVLDLALVAASRTLSEAGGRHAPTQACSAPNAKPENIADYLTLMAKSLADIKLEFHKLNSLNAKRDVDATALLIALKELRDQYFCASNMVASYKESKNRTIAESADALSQSYQLLGAGVSSSMSEFKSNYGTTAHTSAGDEADRQSDYMLLVKKRWALATAGISLGASSAMRLPNPKTKKSDTLLITRRERDEISRILKSQFTLPLKWGDSDPIDTAAGLYFNFLNDAWKFK
jgi:hypothetical protein